MPATRGNGVVKRVAGFLSAIRQIFLMRSVEVAVGHQPNVALPHRQRVARLALVWAAVVDARRSGAVAASMVEDLLDNVRRYSNIAHARGDGSPNIVQV